MCLHMAMEASDRWQASSVQVHKWRGWPRPHAPQQGLAVGHSLVFCTCAPQSPNMTSGAGPGLQRGLEREQGRTQGAGVNTATCGVKTCAILRGSLRAVLAVGFFSCERKPQIPSSAEQVTSSHG